MVIKNVNLETVCGITSKLPDHTLPEIAFAGKSNVGKSSLINALMNRKALARTSAKPGKTQTINFYNINEEMYLVDLPGYGYAKVSEQEKAQWGKLIERYLHGSKQLRAVFLLIDIRHDPSANDKMMYDWIVHQGFNRISCFCSGKFFFVGLSSFYNRDRQNFFTEICINIQHLDRTCFCFFCCCVCGMSFLP